MSNFVETWKAIAHAMGRSERWCRYMAQQPEAPLPVFKVGGIVRLNLADRDSWLAQARERTQVRSLIVVTPAPLDGYRLSA